MNTVFSTKLQTHPLVYWMTVFINQTAYSVSLLGGGRRRSGGAQLVYYVMRSCFLMPSSPS
jgi:hypothetical protein